MTWEAEKKRTEKNFWKKKIHNSWNYKPNWRRYRERISKPNDRSESIKKKQKMKEIKRHFKIISNHLMKEINIYLITISEGKNREKKWRNSNISRDTGWKFSRMNRRPRIQETLKVPRRINKKEIHIQIHHAKLQNAKGKEVIFKPEERSQITYKGTNN